MPAEIFTRLAWTAALIALGLLLYWLTNRLVLRNAAGKARSLPAFRLGKWAIIYFTTPECMPCKMVQRPALKNLQGQLGDKLQVIEINAQEKPELAKDWGVLSVPTTFIVDPAGRPVHVNHGVTPANRLLEQLGQMG